MNFPNLKERLDQNIQRPCFIIASCIKTLFLPSYKSTDFEVHRNWLALTSSLPPHKWYSEATSQWTLDYPPLFAWFEYVLSLAGGLVDPAMLEVNNLEYSSWKTVVFQRMSVVLTDLVFALGINGVAHSLPHLVSKQSGRWSGRFSKQRTLVWLILSNAGLLMVDHVHFQYNGFLTGILLLSVAAVLQGKIVLAALWFSILLNLKHIYLYIAPAFGIFMLRSYCFKSSKDGRIILSSFSLLNLFSLALSVISICGLSLGPFVLSGQLPQLLSRLFPFKRGLCHAYWAPNFWALYNIGDKLLAVFSPKLGLAPVTQTSTMMSGLVQDISHSVLPNISPLVTLVLTLISMLPAVVKLWRSPSNVNFLRSLIIFAWSSFMFGWHVHEKAIILVIIPLAVAACITKYEASMYIAVSTLGHFSLFPLLFQARELSTKLLMLVCHLLVGTQSLPLAPLSWPECLYLGVSPLLFLYCELLHPVLSLAHLQFLPLLTYSAYTGLGLSFCYVRYYLHFLVS